MLEFAIVGFMGVIVQILFFYCLNSFNEADFIKNNLIAIIIGTICGYYLNNLLTFNKNKLKGKSLISGLFKFLFLSLLTISINISISTIVFSLLKIKYLAILSGISFGFLSNFFISRKIIWKI